MPGVPMTPLPSRWLSRFLSEGGGDLPSLLSRRRLVGVDGVDGVASLSFTSRLLSFFFSALFMGVLLEPVGSRSRSEISEPRLWWLSRLERRSVADCDLFDERPSRAESVMDESDSLRSYKTGYSAQQTTCAEATTHCATEIKTNVGDCVLELKRLLAETVSK